MHDPEDALRPPAINAQTINVNQGNPRLLRGLTPEKPQAPPSGIATSCRQQLPAQPSAQGEEKCLGFGLRGCRVMVIRTNSETLNPINPKHSQPWPSGMIWRGPREPHEGLGMFRAYRKVRNRTENRQPNCATNRSKLRTVSEPDPPPHSPTSSPTHSPPLPPTYSAPPRQSCKGCRCRVGKCKVCTGC